MDRIVYSGIAEKVESVDDLLVSIVRLKEIESGKSRELLVYAPNLEGIEGRNVDILFDFFAQDKGIFQTVAGADFLIGSEMSRYDAEYIRRKLEKKGYKFNF